MNWTLANFRYMLLTAETDGTANNLGNKHIQALAVY
jgi:hypothetical protein